MKVSELIEVLSEMVESNPEVGDYPMIMSSDAEGNHYSVMAEACLGLIEGDNDWDVELLDYDSETYNAVVIWPT